MPTTTTTMQIRTRRRRGRKISRRRPRKVSRRQSLSRRRSKSRSGGKPRYHDTRSGLDSRHADSRARHQQTRAAEQNEEEIAARAILNEEPIKKYLAAQVAKKKEEMKRRQQAVEAGLQYEPPTDTHDNEATVLANVQSMLPPKYRSNIRFDLKTVVATALLLLLASGGLPGADARVIKSNVHIPALTRSTPENTGRINYDDSGKLWSFWDWGMVPDPNFVGPLPDDRAKDYGSYTPVHGTNYVPAKSVPGDVRYVLKNRVPGFVNRDHQAEIDHEAQEYPDDDYDPTFMSTRQV